MTSLDTPSPFARGAERAEWNAIIEPLHVPAKYRKCITCLLHQHGVCSPAHFKELLALHRSPSGMQREFQGFADDDFPKYFRGIHDKVEYLLELPALFPDSTPENFYG